MVKPSKITLRCAAFTLSLVAPAVLSAEWEVSAGVAPQIVYTDNVCLTPEDEQGDWYGIVTPRGSISGSGRRANVSLSTSVDVNSLTNGSLEQDGCGSVGDRDRDQYMPRLNATADAVLVEQWLFIDADVTSSQNDVNPFAPGGNDATDRRGNTNTTYRYSVSPYISRRFKDLASMLLRYTYDDQYNTKDVVGDSSQHSAVFNLNGGPVFSPVTWSLQGNYSKTEYSDRPGQPIDNNSELKSAQLNLGYQINRSWQINGFYGNEWNDFVSSRDDIDGDYWGVGFRWTPTARTSVEAGSGDRFFGNTPWLRISHRHKRSLFSVDYEKTLTYSRDIRTLDTGGDFGGVGNATSRSNSPILDERITLTYTYSGRQYRLNINGSYSDQTREQGTDPGDPTLVLRESTFKGVSMSLSRPLSRKWSLSGSLSWDEQEPKGERSQLITSSETWRATLGAQRRLNNNANLALRYIYTDRQSDSFSNEYQENRISLTVRFNLL